MLDLQPFLRSSRVGRVFSAAVSRDGPHLSILSRDGSEGRKDPNVPSDTLNAELLCRVILDASYAMVRQQAQQIATQDLLSLVVVTGVEEARREDDLAGVLVD